jgi:hypothetical protein
MKPLRECGFSPHLSWLSIFYNILWRIEPLLCNDHEMGGYTSPVPGQRLSKHVPIARQQILNNTTAVLQQWKGGVSGWSALRCYKQGTKPVDMQFCTGVRRWRKDKEVGVKWRRVSCNSAQLKVLLWREDSMCDIWNVQFSGDCNRLRTQVCVSVICKVESVSSLVGYSPDSNDVSTEAEESPLLRSVTRKRLVKADWEHLACPNDLWSVEIINGAVLFAIRCLPWTFRRPFLLRVVWHCQSLTERTLTIGQWGHDEAQ